MIYRILRFAAWLLLRIFHRLRGVDTHHLPPDGAVILASNHSSFLDPMALGCVVDRKVTFIARGSLKAHWLYRWLTAKLDIVSIERDSGDRRQLDAVLAALRQGKACAIFPEGTRSRDGELQPFKAGVVLLARLSRAPVVPVWIDGTFQAWPRHAKLPRFSGRITTYYGEPIALHEERDRDAALAKLEGAIRALRPGAAPAMR
jgi:1-acyl-sn-glycerol-3-phosphate acyltransferase